VKPFVEKAEKKIDKPRGFEAGGGGAAFQIIQLAELVKRFAHNAGNVGEIQGFCTIMEQNQHVTAR